MIDYLTAVLYGTWTPPTEAPTRRYRAGRQVMTTSETEEFVRGQLLDEIRAVFTRFPDEEFTRREIADETGADMASVKTVLLRMAKRGDVLYRTEKTPNGGRPLCYYRGAL